MKNIESILTNRVSSLAKNIKAKFQELSDFEALQIAAKIQQNGILFRAFGVENDKKYWSFLDQIQDELAQQNPKTKANYQLIIDALLNKLNELSQ